MTQESTSLQVISNLYIDNYENALQTFDIYDIDSSNRTSSFVVYNKIIADDNKQTLEIHTREMEDMYSLDCTKQLCCNNNDRITKLSRCFRSPKFGVYIAIMIVIYVLVAIFQGLLQLWINVEYCSIKNPQNYIQIVKGIIVTFIGILSLFSFNFALFKRQFKEFETWYKLFNCLRLMVLINIYEYHVNWHVYRDDNTLACVIAKMMKETLFLSNVTWIVMFATLSDGWRVSLRNKAILYVVCEIGIIYYYIYIGTSTIYKHDKIKIDINIFNWISTTTHFEAYYSIRDALEIIIFFITKQTIMFFYNEFEFDFNICNCNCVHTNCKCGGQRKNCALAISVKKTIIWKRYTIDTDGIQKLLVKSGINVDNMDNNMGDISSMHMMNEESLKDDKLRINVMAGDNLYNKLFGSTIRYNDSVMTRIFQTRRAWVVFVFLGILCLVLTLVQSIIFNNDELSTCSLILGMIRSILIIVVSCLVLLSYNIPLIKEQLLNFETIYKLYNVLVIFVAEVIYILVANDRLNMTHFVLLFINETFYFIALFLVVIGVSCVDAWNTHTYTKIGLLIVGVIVLTYWYLELMILGNREEDDYLTWKIPLFNRRSNGYHSQQFAFQTIILFLIKQLALLTYFEINLCNNGNCGQNPGKSLVIAENPVIKWHN